MKKALILLVVLVLLAGLLFGLYHFLWTADNFAALGEKAMKSGNYARAVDRYTTAVSLAPDNVDYVLALADASLADGSYTRAERTLVEAIRTAPSEQLYRRLSATYVAQDKLLDAQQMLDSITDPAIRASLEAAAGSPSTDSGWRRILGLYHGLGLCAERNGLCIRDGAVPLDGGRALC